jgi:hypothetical protein
MNNPFGHAYLVHEDVEEPIDNLDMDVSQNVWKSVRSTRLGSTFEPASSSSAPLHQDSPIHQVRAPLLSPHSTPSEESTTDASSHKAFPTTTTTTTTLYFGSTAEAAWQSVQNGATKYTSYSPDSYYNNGFGKTRSILDMDPSAQLHQAFEMTELGLPTPTVQVEYEPPSLGEPRKTRGFWSRLFSRSAATPSSSSSSSSSRRLDSLSATLFRPKKAPLPQRSGCLARLWYGLPSPNPDQRHTLLIMALQLCLALILYNVPYGEHIIYPFHLMGVLFHELGHASMASLSTYTDLHVGS